MGLDKDLNNNVLSDDALEAVSGGMEHVKKLKKLNYTGKEDKKISDAVQKGKPGLASNLLHKEVSRKTVEDAVFCGDFTDKGTLC